jgi:hypothetical protein
VSRITVVPGAPYSQYDLELGTDLIEAFRDAGFVADWRDLNLSRNLEVRDLVEDRTVHWICISASSHKQQKLTDISLGEVRKVMDWTSIAALNVCRWILYTAAEKPAYHYPRVLLVMPRPTADPEIELPWFLARDLADRIIEYAGDRFELFVSETVEDAVSTIIDCE